MQLGKLYWFFSTDLDLQNQIAAEKMMKSKETIVENYERTRLWHCFWHRASKWEISYVSVSNIDWNYYQLHIIMYNMLKSI